MDYIKYFLENKRVISFGFILTFFSSFGQTFLISLYLPKIIHNFQLTNSSFGGLYGFATVGSSVLLIYGGKLIDHMDLRKYAVYSALLLMLSCILLAFSMNFIMVFISLLGLRLSGQGLMSHISRTTISKTFQNDRGKALSITSLGYAAGEGVLPAVVSLLIAYIGWRYSLIANSALIGLVLVPFIWFTISKEQTAISTGPKPSGSFSRLFLLRDKRFYLLALNAAATPFLLTGLFFFQTVLADHKAWNIEWLSFCFMGYAIGRILFSIVSGPLIDRYSAIKLFPFYLLPFLSGLILLLTVNHIYAGLFYLFFAGVSVGFGTIVNTAAIAEIYGLKNLGGIGSVFSTLKVFGTALSPVLFGLLIDHDASFSSIIIFGIIFLCVIVLLNTQYMTKLDFVFDTDS